MEWEKKTELCALANKAQDLESRKKFVTFVVEHMDEFDEQSWDMFFTGVELIPEDINENIELHKQIQQKIEDIDLKTESYRTALRMGMYKQLIVG